MCKEEEVSIERGPRLVDEVLRDPSQSEVT